MDELPTVGVLAVVALGLAVVALVDWRAGALLVGLGLVAAAGLRLSLSPRRAGLLVVRSRRFDAVVLIALGFATVALALAVPRP